MVYLELVDYEPAVSLAGIGSRAAAEPPSGDA
jgi:hypothetical protein